MNDFVTIARPYARAAFMLAKETATLDAWQKSLMQLAHVVADEKVESLIKNPNVDLTQKLKNLMNCVAQLGQAQQNFLHLLGEVKKLLLLPEIAKQFGLYRQQLERKITVEINAFYPLSNKYQTQLKQALNKRLNQEIDLHVKLDPTLLGGAVVRAGDLVIDVSVLSRLEQCARQLQNT